MWFQSLRTVTYSECAFLLTSTIQKTSGALYWLSQTFFYLPWTYPVVGAGCPSYPRRIRIASMHFCSFVSLIDYINQSFSSYYKRYTMVDLSVSQHFFLSRCGLPVCPQTYRSCCPEWASCVPPSPPATFPAGWTGSWSARSVRPARSLACRCGRLTSVGWWRCNT